MTGEGALAEAAANAPTGAGVYFFLDDGRRLLYIGKASNLRRRLQQHAKELPTHAASKYARVRFVAWAEVPDDHAAHCREADLIVAFRPAQNAAIVDGARWAYVAVSEAAHDDECTFLLTADPAAARGRHAFGCFPHLGGGQSSRPGIACSDGYTALLRLLWATRASTTRAYPRSISGLAPPPKVRVPVPPGRRPRLHRFLSGTSARLLDDLRAGVTEVEPYLRPALARDLELARAFFDHGPAAVRDLRRRHDAGPGPLSRERIEALLRVEVTASIGEFVLGRGSERARRRFVGGAP